jgi:exo-1,4-beta-D-glucosaminidase
MRQLRDGYHREFQIGAESEKEIGDRFRRERRRLKALSDKTRVLSTNFYWLPKKLSTFDWSTEHEKQHPYYTGVTSYEDLSMLNQLRRVQLDVTASSSRPAEGEDVRVQVRNPSSNLAFQIHLSVVSAKSGEEILPVFWEDNYLSLMSGESRAVVAHYTPAPNAGPLSLEVDGWNIEAKAIFIEEARPN